MLCDVPFSHRQSDCFGATMLQLSHARLAVLLVWALANAPALAESEQEKRPPNEAEQILRDAQKQGAETPKEIADCMKQWGPNTQMTKEE